MIMIILADVDNDFSHDSVNMYFPTQFTADKGQIYVWKAFGYTPFFTLNSKYTCLKENLEYGQKIVFAQKTGCNCKIQEKMVIFKIFF